MAPEGESVPLRSKQKRTARQIGRLAVVPSISAARDRGLTDRQLWGARRAVIDGLGSSPCWAQAAPVRCITHTAPDGALPVGPGEVRDLDAADRGEVRGVEGLG